MSEWTTDLRQAQPGWLVEQDCVGVDDAGRCYDITKTGHVVSVEERIFTVVISSGPLSGDERWLLSYGDTKVRVREP